MLQERRRNASERDSDSVPFHPAPRRALRSCSVSRCPGRQLPPHAWLSRTWDHHLAAHFRYPEATAARGSASAPSRGSMPALHWRTQLRLQQVPSERPHLASPTSSAASPESAPCPYPSFRTVPAFASTVQETSSLPAFRLTADRAVQRSGRL